MENRTISEMSKLLDSCSYKEFIEIKERLKYDTRKNVRSLLEKVDRKFQNYNRLIEEFNARRKYELRLLSENCRLIAGIDEVGRGPLAGPVYTAAVILDPEYDIYGIKDSKKLSAAQRERLSRTIKEKSIAYAIGIASVEEIDRLNILNATKLAMKRAIEGLMPKPGHLLIDALELKDVDIPQTSIIKGDDLSVSIGAASIIAKVERDSFMDSIAEKYPQYLFGKNKGYGTREHIEGIQKYGICEYHRKTFIRNFI